MASGKIPPNYFLHVYHHSIVILNTWFWLESAASLQFIGLLFNTAVHVVMYYYYYLRSIGIVPKWKNFVTTFQVVQFVTSALSFLVTMYFVLLKRYLNFINFNGALFLVFNFNVNKGVANQWTNVKECMSWLARCSSTCRCCMASQAYWAKD
jgi:hypothetical protein